MRRFAFAILLLAACGGDGGPAETEGAPPGPPDTTASSSSGAPVTSSTSSTGEPAEVCCEGAADDLSCSPCSDDAQFCSALRFFGEDVTGEDYVCRDACVPTDAGAYWCADDTSCCDADATCDAQGFCRRPDEGTSTSTSGSSGSDSSSSSGEESSSSSSSSSGM